MPALLARGLRPQPPSSPGVQEGESPESWKRFAATTPSTSVGGRELGLTGGGAYPRSRESGVQPLDGCLPVSGVPMLPRKACCAPFVPLPRLHLLRTAPRTGWVSGIYPHVF